MLSVPGIMIKTQAMNADALSVTVVFGASPMVAVSPHTSVVQETPFRRSLR